MREGDVLGAVMSVVTSGAIAENQFVAERVLNGQLSRAPRRLLRRAGSRILVFLSGQLLLKSAQLRRLNPNSRAGTDSAVVL